METAVRSHRLGSWFRRKRNPNAPEAKSQDRSPADRSAPAAPSREQLLDGLGKHAGPAWMVSPDLQTIIANPAARAHIDALAAELGREQGRNTRQQLDRAYTRTLLSALRVAHGSDRRFAPGGANACLPQRLTCSVDGHPLELLFLEVRGVPSAGHPPSATSPAEQTIAYLLVA